MSTNKWSVRIHNGKGEHWDTVPAEGEFDARTQAVGVTTVNKSWAAFVRKDGETVASYRKGMEYHPRVKKEAKR